MPLSTIVVGGGIGGLSLARQLTNGQLPVVVLERAPRLGLEDDALRRHRDRCLTERRL